MMDSVTICARRWLRQIADHLHCDLDAIPAHIIEHRAAIYRAVCAEHGETEHYAQLQIDALRREYAALKTPAPSGEATPSASLEDSGFQASSAVDAAAALAAMRGAQGALSTAQNAIATERDHALQALRATGSASFDGVIDAINGALQACEAVQRRAADLVACALASNDN